MHPKRYSLLYRALSGSLKRICKTCLILNIQWIDIALKSHLEDQYLSLDNIERSRIQNQICFWYALAFLYPREHIKIFNGKLQIEMNLCWWPSVVILQRVYKETTPTNKNTDRYTAVQITLLPGSISELDSCSNYFIGFESLPQKNKRISEAQVLLSSSHSKTQEFTNRDTHV